MKLSTSISLLIGTCAALSLSACGQAFSSSHVSSSSAPTSSGTGGGSNNQSSSTNSQYQALQIHGYVAGGANDGMQVISLDKANNQILISVPLPLGSLGGISAASPITQLPGATIGVETDSSGNSAVVLRIPVSYVLHGVAFAEPSRLPNGQPLPSIPGGELPSVAVSLTGKTKATIYLSQALIGIYVPTSFNPYISLTLPIRSDDGLTTWGFLSSVPAIAGYQGGFFLSFQLPGDIARLIDDNL